MGDIDKVLREFAFETIAYSNAFLKGVTICKAMAPSNHLSLVFTPCESQPPPSPPPIGPRSPQPFTPARPGMRRGGRSNLGISGYGRQCASHGRVHSPLGMHRLWACYPSFGLWPGAVHSKMNASSNSALFPNTAKNALDRFRCPFRSRKTLVQLLFSH
jgi:hypothetical protein